MARLGQQKVRAKSRTAFLVEALVLLVVVAGVLAVLMSVLAMSYNMGKQSKTEAQAILLATNAAETFAAKPEEGVEISSADGLMLCRVVSAHTQPGGMLYRAHIAVYDEDEVRPYTGTTSTKDYAAGLLADAVFEIETARYVSEVNL